MLIMAFIVSIVAAGISIASVVLTVRGRRQIRYAARSAEAAWELVWREAAARKAAEPWVNDAGH
jgi:hypothetical protein